MTRLAVKTVITEITRMQVFPGSQLGNPLLSELRNPLAAGLGLRLCLKCEIGRMVRTGPGQYSPHSK